VKRRRTPSRHARASCPQCGGEFPAGRPACPHCGSDAETGWSEGHEFHAFDDEDYEDVVADLRGEDPLARDLKWRRRKLLLQVTGLVVVAALVAGVLALL
jgi:hypothetical protein